MTTTKNRKKNKAITLITPVGVLKFPRLTEVDYGTDKYPDKAGSYRTQLVLNKDATGVVPFLSKLEELMQQAKLEAEERLAEMPMKTRNAIASKGGLTANPPYSELFDDETEEATGEVELKIKKRASYERTDGKVDVLPPPPLFDNAKPPKLLGRKVGVWGGTQASINISVTPYFMSTGAYGLSLRLNAVQIIKLVDSGGARDATSYGFTGSEGGWDSSEMDEDIDADISDDTEVEDIDAEANF